MFVAITDKDWFNLHANAMEINEVNFWRPSSEATFRALGAGELLLFKLHSPDNFIVGGGFFTRFLQMQLTIAWDAFRAANGARTLTEMRERIGKYRRQTLRPDEDPIIGCILLGEPFFWPRDLWISVPDDFSANIVQGKGYSSEDGTGRVLLEAVRERLQHTAARELDTSPATNAVIETGGFGKPIVRFPRLGQGSFRLVVTDLYERQCALTGEKTLPVLDAAHIKPYPIVQKHEVQNGILMRSDLHRLFDAGYLSINPLSRSLEVSRRIREEFSNGREYYKLQGTELRNPSAAWAEVASENLEFHYNAVFKR